MLDGEQLLHGLAEGTPLGRRMPCLGDYVGQHIATLCAGATCMVIADCRLVQVCLPQAACWCRPSG